MSVVSVHDDGRALIKFIVLPLLLASTLLVTLPVSAQADPRAAALDTYVRLLGDSVNAAQRACLSNISTQESRSLSFNWRAILSQISSAVSIEKKTEEIRGATRSLPAQAQLIEDDSIRTCINEKMTPIFAMAVDVFQPSAGTSAWPDPIDFRFNYIRGPSKSSRVYTEFLRADLQTRAGPLSDRLVKQDPQGTAYFGMRLGYPKPGEIVTGTIVAERVASATLTAVPPSITKVCFERPPNFPSGQAGKFDMFDCAEGKLCKSSDRSTGWLKACGENAPAHHTWLPPLPLTPTYAAMREQSDNTTTEGSPYWSVPSLRALADDQSEGVGYAIFTLDTDLFRQRDVSGVEVNLRVNGVPVREDGLPAELRPVANHPNGPFVHRFALQTLDFEGAQGGCDRIELTLRPVMADGHKGDPRSSTLTYVALRDVAPRVQKLGEGELKWSAAYITPRREWRHIAEVHSYTYMTSDPATQQLAVRHAEEDKLWLDRLGLRYEEQRIVGVIRPPRTVTSSGSAAYGLGVGLIQESGQVRFTFSEGEARRLAAFMIAQRGKLSHAAQIIDSRPYIFQAIGGSHTAIGVCVN